MENRLFSDFFRIGNLAVMSKEIGNASYDFDFRTQFVCSSVTSSCKEPVLLRIGAIDDYSNVENDLKKNGCILWVDERSHVQCSTIENWYPLLKEHTPRTEVFDELPSIDVLEKKFKFPVFIKGNRQTSRHKRSQCIINNPDEYESLRNEWNKDDILFWQKVAIREYVPLKEIDSTSYPDMIPISYEFRFFYFLGKCVAHGPYWTLGKKYDLPKEEYEKVKELTDWAEKQLSSAFVAIDVAQTADGEWIIIEVNDAQESGYGGVNPISLWTGIVEIMDMKWNLTPFSELHQGTKSIYDYVKDGYTVPDKVIAYLRTQRYLGVCPGTYDHPFKPGERLPGPYRLTDGHYTWDRDTWKYVLKYHLTLPEEFINYVMSDDGDRKLTELVNETIEKNEAWSDSIKECKKKQGYKCLLLGPGGSKELSDF